MNTLGYSTLFKDEWGLQGYKLFSYFGLKHIRSDNVKECFPQVMVSLPIYVYCFHYDTIPMQLNVVFHGSMKGISDENL